MRALLGVSLVFLSACGPPAAVRYALSERPPLADLTEDEASRAIGSVLKESRFRSRDFGIEVVDLADGRRVYSRNAGEPMVLASNAKIVTAAAALKLLGSGHRFGTEVYAHEGVLWIRGGGDPSLTLRRLREFARRARFALGDRAFSGIVGLDDGLFDTRESIEPGFSLSGSFNTAIGPLSVDRNEVRISLSEPPGASGDPRPLEVLVRPDPQGFRVDPVPRPVDFELHHHPQFEVGFDEAAGVHTVTLYGPLGEKAKTLGLRRPAVHFGRVFKEAALMEGIAVGEVRMGTVPAGAEKLFSLESPPLGSILSDMVMESDNFLAEMIVMALAAASGKRTREDGLAALSDYLAKTAGLGGRAPVVANGSGLSRTPQLSARQVAGLLRAIDADPAISAAFKGLLPGMGWSGTLGRRGLFPPALLRASAKTGMIDYVSCLSGYARGPSGRRFAFSILINDRRGLKRTADWSWLRREEEGEWRWTTNVYSRQRGVQDAVVEILARIR